MSIVDAPESPPLVLHLPPAIEMTEEQFFDFCQINRDLRIERTARGDIVIMPPAGGESGAQNSELNLQLGLWAKQDRRGVAFDSSTGFNLPNGATRSPDASWVLRSRLAKLSSKQKKKFLPLCPDFVIELRSPSDQLSLLKGKMEEYVANGAALGWLIDPIDRRVYVYRSGSKTERLDDPTELSGDPILAGFVLSLAEIWEVDF